MPRLKLTKSAIDALPPPAKDTVYWDSGCPGFGVKITPKGRKVFVVLYRAGGARSRLRKYTIGPHGRVTLHQARAAALKIFAARTEGRDPAAEKQQARRRLVTDRVEDLVELFIAEYVSKTRSAREISRLLRREVIPCWPAQRSRDQQASRHRAGNRSRCTWHSFGRQQAPESGEDLLGLVRGARDLGPLAGGAVAGAGARKSA